MQILLRITKMAWRYRVRLVLAYVSFFAAIGFALLVPRLFGTSVDRLVRFDPANGHVIPLQVDTGTLALMALALLGASVMRGVASLASTYTTDSLSQKVSYDLRNLLYDKLQHLSFAFHDREHTGNLMSKATADIEQIRRFVNLGLVRSLDVVIRLIAIISILCFLNWKLALLSLAFVPFSVLQSTMVLRKLRPMWLRVQEIMGESVTVLQENLVGIHVVKAFAAEEYEQQKYARKAQELREHYFQSERLQETNGAWMSFYFTCTLGLILWLGGWEVIRGHLTAGGLSQFILYMKVPGQITAILGAPGSGKSTIVHLLPRFYDVTAGQITIDGQDIRDFTLHSLRRNVGIVQQDVYLFSATIRDNIAYGASHASFEEVVRAAKIAQLHDQIMRFRDGYDTSVGERGVTLSGGQRQRLSIARTILLDPPILILDDSTSSVDVETERRIHQAMIAVMQGRTTFVIAHRLSTVRQADLILVLQDGEIVERGTHHELMAQRGIYQDIYEIQLRPQEEQIQEAAMVRDNGGAQ